MKRDRRVRIEDMKSIAILGLSSLLWAACTD